MNNYLIGLLPFYYTKSYRYYQGMNILGYLLGEVLPLIMFIYFFSNIELSNLIIGYIIVHILFYSFYEIGYFMNDCFNTNPVLYTSRATTTICHNIKTIIILRIPIVVLSFVMLDLYFDSYIPLVVIMLIILIVFYIHNTLLEYKYRLLTLIILGIMKPIFFLYIFNVEVTNYIFILFPLLLIKYIDYMYAKKLTTLNIREDRVFRFFLTLLWIIPILVINFKLIYIYLIIFLQINIKYIIQKCRLK